MPSAKPGIVAGRADGEPGGKVTWNQLSGQSGVLLIPVREKGRKLGKVFVPQWARNG